TAVRPLLGGSRPAESIITFSTMLDPRGSSCGPLHRDCPTPPDLFVGAAHMLPVSPGQAPPDRAICCARTRVSRLSIPLLALPPGLPGREAVLLLVSLAQAAASGVVRARHGPRGVISRWSPRSSVAQTGHLLALGEGPSPTCRGRGFHAGRATRAGTGRR